MTRDEIASLFVVLVGYWPHSAPDIDDPVAVAAHHDLLDSVTLDQALAAARRIAADGETFCPPPGVLAGDANRKTPPYYRPYVPELEPPAEITVDVPALLADARSELHRGVNP